MEGIRAQVAASIAAFRAVFRNPDLRRTQGAWALSITAEWMFVVALAVYAYRSGGATAVGVLAVVRMIPAALVAPVAATFVDRVRRERVLLAVELLRAVLIGISALVLSAPGRLAPVAVVACLVSIVSTAHRPTQAALLPALCTMPEELTATNVSVTTIESLGTLVGPALAGVFLSLSSVGTACAVAAGAYLLSALLVSRISTSEPPTTSRESASLRGQLAGGFQALKEQPNSRVLVGLFGAQTLVRGSLNVLIVVVALRLLALGPSGVGYLTSAIGAGGLVGGVLTSSLIGRRRLATPFGLGIVLWGLPIVGIGLMPSRAGAFAMLLVLGVGNSLVDVAGLTLLQRTVPDAVLGRVFGILEAMVLGSIGLGAAIAPLLASTVGLQASLIVTGAVLPALIVASWGRLRRIDSESRAVPAERVSLLRRLPFFSPLPLSTIEYLTERLVEVPVRAGDVVIREGEPGDRFYIIEQGSFDVSANGSPIRLEGPGEYFGEIALLHDVPRTATVIAGTDGTLFALEQDEFLGAVTGHPASAEAAAAAAVGRMQTSGARLTTL